MCFWLRWSWWEWASPVVLSRGCSVALCGLLVAVTSLVSVHGLLGAWASVTVACGLSCPMACGIFPDQGASLCALRWQVVLTHWTTREIQRPNILESLLLLICQYQM